MAKAVGLVGSIVNKAGNFVFSTWKGIQVVKAYQPNVSNPRSIPQELQRICFKDCVDYGVAMTNQPFLKALWNHFAPSKMSGFNYMVQTNLNQAARCTPDHDANQFLEDVPRILPFDVIPTPLIGCVSPITAVGTCAAGKYTAIEVTPGIGCGEDPNCYLFLRIYHTMTLTLPEQSPFRGAHICASFYAEGEEPATLDNDFAIFNGCNDCAECPPTVDTYGFIIIPMVVAGTPVTGTFPLISDVIAVGLPYSICHTPA